jgi:hypothetical protein
MYKTTRYFDEVVLRRRPYVTLELCIAVIENPVAREVQQDGRIRMWGFPVELGNRALRVITLDDGVTIHNAFLDRGFRRRS